VRESAQLGTQPEARVGVTDHQAVGVQGQEDVAQRALGDAQGSRELADPLWPTALGERAQHARCLVDRWDGSEAARTLRHTRTGESTREPKSQHSFKLA